MTHENSLRSIRRCHLHAASALVVAALLAGCAGGGDASETTMSSGLDYKSLTSAASPAVRPSEQPPSLEYKSSMPKKKESKQLSPEIDLDPGASREMEDESQEDDSESRSEGKGKGQGEGKTRGGAGDRSARR